MTASISDLQRRYLSNNVELPKELAHAYELGGIELEDLLLMGLNINKEKMEQALVENKSLQSLLVEQQEKLAELHELNDENTTLKLQNLNLKGQVEQGVKDSLMRKTLEMTVSSLKSKLANHELIVEKAGRSEQLSRRLEMTESELEKALLMVASLEKRLLSAHGEKQDLINQFASTNQRIKSLEAELEKRDCQIASSKDELRAFKEENSELRLARSEDQKLLNRVYEEVQLVQNQANLFEDNHKELHRKNLMQSMYMNSHSTAPLYESPNGDILRLYTFDANDLRTAEGGNIKTYKDTATFFWHNRNGFGAMLTLTENHAEHRGVQVLMPSIINDCGLTDEQVQKVNEQLCPPDEALETLIDFMMDFDVADFKSALTESFIKAQFVSEEYPDIYSKIYGSNFDKGLLKKFASTFDGLKSSVMKRKNSAKKHVKRKLPNNRAKAKT